MPLVFNHLISCIDLLFFITNNKKDPPFMQNEIDEASTLNTLNRMSNAGLDLTQPRLFDFQLWLPNQGAAIQISHEVFNMGFKASIYQDDEDRSWTCECSKVIIPSFENVIEIERKLHFLAQSYDGYSDGFGTMG